QKKTLTTQVPFQPVKDSIANYSIDFFPKKLFNVWPMETAVGGGPVLVQNNEVKITNLEEFKFTGKAIHDKHPRTAIGYLKKKELIILVIQGRFPSIAEGATLLQTAQILKELGCIEAMNLDGGGSSCLLINGKGTIQPSDKTGQRAVPAVLLIKQN
ncbi:MAG: phosphodiester glycosidase family protein, partial [Chitinophagaceae bacterium]